MSFDEHQREFEEAAEAVAREYETRMRDELELALEREESLTQEKINGLEAKSKPATGEGARPAEPALPRGPAEEGYQRVMGTLTMGSSRSIGQGATLAFVFISYPLGGALLGYIIDRWFVIPQTGASSWIPILVGTLLGFYNGVIEMLRHARRLELEAKAVRDEQRKSR